jgi:ankyrin repeat protein
MYLPSVHDPNYVWTPVHHAILHGRYEILKYFLKELVPCKSPIIATRLPPPDDVQVYIYP